MCPFPNRANTTQEQQEFNSHMSQVRIAVEFGFGKVISEFAFVDFKKNQKLLLQDVAAIYVTAVILTNCHSCLYSNQTDNNIFSNMPKKNLTPLVFTKLSAVLFYHVL